MALVLGIVAMEGDNVRIEGIQNHRPLHTVSFLARYNFIDFPISNFTNSGIDKIHVYIKYKPRTVYEHIGTGSQYNINSKHGRIRVMYGEKSINSKFYNTDILSYLQNLEFISSERVDYVIVAPSHFSYTQDFRKVLDEHISSGADITVLYKEAMNCKDSFLGCTTLKFIKGSRLVDTDINRGQKPQNKISLETYIMKKELFIDLVRKAYCISPIYWFKDVIAESLEELDIRGYAVESGCYATLDLRSYYDNSMTLLNVYNKNLFSNEWPIFTRTSDSAPTVYGKQSKVINSLVSNGSIIHGEVYNSIIGRDVEIGEGTVLEDCIVMSHSHIGKNKRLKGLVIDKYVSIEKIDKIMAEPGDILYINRNDRI